MREKILALLGKKGEMPPLPDILSRLSAKINNPECDLLEIAALIKTEPVLSGRLNKLANSVFYGGGLDQSRDISTAVMRLGLKMVMDLAYALEVPKMFLKTKGLDQRQFWRHSLAVAILSKIIGKRLLKGKKDQENVYIAGLMHDIGMLVFCFLIPEEYAEFLKTVPSLEGILSQMEQSKFGLSHHELGAVFVEKWWHLEPSIVQSIRGCNSSDPSKPLPTPCALMVSFADEIVNDAGILNGVKIKTPLPVRKNLLRNMGISSDDLVSMLKEMKNGLESMETVLNG